VRSSTAAVDCYLKRGLSTWNVLIVGQQASQAERSHWHEIFVPAVDGALVGGLRTIASPIWLSRTPTLLAALEAASAWLLSCPL